MKSVVIYIQLGSVMEIEDTKIDDGGVPSPSDPSRFKVWCEAKIVLNTGKNYTQDRVGKFKSIFPIFKMAF